MPFYKDFENRKEILKRFIKEHPNTTHKEIKEKLHMKVMKIYSGGLEEAFRDVGIEPPRTFKRTTLEERRKIIIDFIRKNPKAGGHIIKKATKINLATVFKNTEKMFKAANIYHNSKKNINLIGKKSERKKIILETIRKNPFMSLSELSKTLRMSTYHHFHDVKQLYKEAGVEYLGKGIKRKIKKQNSVIEFIKKNQLATQREINSSCKTQVQKIFDRGIFEAYEKAIVDFPFERLNVHGVVIKQIKDEAIAFEKEIAKRLSCYGKVNRLVKTKNGIADILFERKNKKVVIEVKNYKSHEISISQIKQLNKYLEAINTDLGFLVCLKKPKKDSFLIGKNKIIILTDSELFKIPELIDLDL